MSVPNLSHYEIKKEFEMFKYLSGLMTKNIVIALLLGVLLGGCTLKPDGCLPTVEM